MIEEWFDKKYSQLGGRFDTMKLALETLSEKVEKGALIVETGCVRMAEDWGAGMSSVVFCDYLKRHDGRLISIDIDPKNVKFCEQATKEYESLRTVICSDSVKHLHEVAKNFKIDLLYLDSWDYPYFELIDIYGSRDELEKSNATLQALGEEFLVEHHGDMIIPPQTHCLKELMAALPGLHDESIIMIDDNELPGGGKSRLAKNWLRDNGWKCLLDSQQTLWVKAELEE